MLASFVGFKRAHDDILLVCSRDLLAPTLKRLSMFVLRAKAKLSDASAEVAVYGLVGDGQGWPAPTWAKADQGEVSLVRLPDAQGRARALWLAKLDRAADHFLTQDSKHGGAAIMLETPGSLRIDPPGFTLHGKPDRIDALHDGRLRWDQRIVMSANGARTYQSLMEGGAPAGGRGTAVMAVLVEGMTKARTRKGGRVITSKLSRSSRSGRNRP